VVAGSFTLEAVMPHLLGFLLASGTPVASFLTTGRFLRAIPGWRRFGTWLLLGSPLTLVLLVGFFLTFDPAAAGANVGIAGLVQRALAVEVHAWFVAMGWLAYRRS
jgi:high-affinity Fe2+/Pb2+ permease